MSLKGEGFGGAKLDVVWRNENAFFEAILGKCGEQSNSRSMCCKLEGGCIVKKESDGVDSSIQVWIGENGEEKRNRGAVITKKTLMGSEIIIYGYEDEMIENGNVEFATVVKGSKLEIPEHSYIFGKISEGAYFQQGNRLPKRKAVTLMEGTSCIELMREYIESNEHETAYPISNEMMYRIISGFEGVLKTVYRDIEPETPMMIAYRELFRRVSEMESELNVLRGENAGLQAVNAGLRDINVELRTENERLRAANSELRTKNANLQAGKEQLVNVLKSGNEIITGKGWAGTKVANLGAYLRRALADMAVSGVITEKEILGVQGIVVGDNEKSTGVSK